MDRRLRVALVMAVLLALVLVAQPAVAEVDARTVIEDVKFVTGIAFLSDGTMVFNERDGVIRTADARRRLGDNIAEIPTVVEGETGLLGIAVAPDERSVYVFATEIDGESNSVWRAGLDGEDPERVVTEMPASLYHNGGGVAFDEDGMLLVSNGEEHDTGLAQDPAVLGGKVYRFTPEGDVPPGGPFGDGPSLAIGLRNPYGLTIDPSTGDAWVTENGPSSFDEINRIVPGGNYGWPDVSGPATDGGPDLEGDYQDPAIAYESIIVPTGIAFAGENATDQFAGDLFFAAYGEGVIHHLGLNDRRDEVVSDEIVHEAGEPVIALAWGPEGLYFSTADAIKVLPMAAADDSSPSSAAGGASPVVPSPSPSRTRERDFGVGSVLTIAVLVALLLVFLGTRSRMKQASRD